MRPTSTPSNHTSPERPNSRSGMNETQFYTSTSSRWMNQPSSSSSSSHHAAAPNSYSPTRSPFRLSSTSNAKDKTRSTSISRGNSSISDSENGIISNHSSSIQAMMVEDEDDQRAVELQLESDMGIGPSLTRVNFYDVVLEDMMNGGNLKQVMMQTDQEEDRDSSILPWLGNVVIDHHGNGLEGENAGSNGNGMPRSSSGNSITAVIGGGNGYEYDIGSKNNSEKLQSRIVELVDTERSYVRRLEALYQRYAVPLRQLARDRDTVIIPLYEAQRLFGNVGELLGANQAFLKDLQFLLLEGPEEMERRIGDIVYKHMACFGCYNEYFSNFEKAKHIEQSMSKTNKNFRDFTDRTKYSLTNIGNTGLRDLLMEPVQRIPRYKLMLDGLIKYMTPTDPQRARLEEAVVLASRIASCEADDKTKKAAVLWSFQRSVDDFPPALVSAQREFIDCIDVDDFPLSDLSASVGGSSAGLFSPGGSSSTSSRALHCTLFLFDDRLAIVKRASSTVNGRRVVGLDDLNRLADQMRTFSERSGNGHSREISNGRKGDLGFRGMLDISDVTATDLGGTDFQFSFAQSPSHVSAEKWSSRLVRRYVTADSSSMSSPRGPPTSSSSHCTPARLEKARFLENLWRAQALYKTRGHRSHVRCLVIPKEMRERNERGSSSWPGDENARRLIYWNVYGRRSYLTEPSKSSIVLHVDLRNDADPLPFGPELAKPHAQLRISSVDEKYGEAAYTTSIKGRPDDDEQLILSLSSLASRMDDLNADACTSNPDFQPVTPSSHSSTPASHRGRVVTGLENFGRNLLFGTPGSIRSAAGSIDVFGSPTKRTKSTMSKSTFTSNSNSNSDNFSSIHGLSTPATSFSSRPLLGLPDTSSLSPKRLSARNGRASSVGPSDSMIQAHGNELTNEHTPKRSSVILSQNGMDWETASPNTSNREHLPQRAKSSPAKDVNDQQMALAQASIGGGLSRTPSKVLGPRDLSSHPSVASESPNQSVSPTRRKSVPAHLSVGENSNHSPSTRTGPSAPPKRIHSGSKRSMPFETSENQVMKRHAHTGSDGEPSPAATARPLSPERINEKGRESSRPSSPLREHATTNNGSRRPKSPNYSSSCHSTSSPERPPNFPQKDDQDARNLSQEELTKRVLRNLERAQDEEKRSRKGVEQIRTEVRSLRNSLRRATGKEKSRDSGESSMREKQNNSRNSPSRDLASEGYEALRRGPLSPTFLEDWMTSIEQWLADADERFQDAASTQKRLRGDVQIMARLYSESSSSANSSPSRSRLKLNEEKLLDEEKENLRKEANEAKALRIQVQALTRKCELLTALESDGRLENTELHKAFNDELDQMYEDTQQPENIEIESLRKQVKQAKAERNQLRIDNKALIRERDLEKSQSEIFKKALIDNNLLPNI